jgi:hypothetical protein
MTTKRKIGSVPPGKLPVIDRHGNLCGHVGAKATAPTAARFTGNPNMKLSKHEGRQSWIEQGTPPQRSPQSRPPETANHKSARGSVRAK